MSVTNIRKFFIIFCRRSQAYRIWLILQNRSSLYPGGVLFPDTGGGLQCRRNRNSGDDHAGIERICGGEQLDQSAGLGAEFCWDRFWDNADVCDVRRGYSAQSDVGVLGLLCMVIW